MQYDVLAAALKATSEMDLFFGPTAKLKIRREP
jgi:hypothetical protein